MVATVVMSEHIFAWLPRWTACDRPTVLWPKMREQMPSFSLIYIKQNSSIPSKLYDKIVSLQNSTKEKSARLIKGWHQLASSLCIAVSIPSEYIWNLRNPVRAHVCDGCARACGLMQSHKAVLSLSTHWLYLIHAVCGEALKPEFTNGPSVHKQTPSKAGQKPCNTKHYFSL